MPKNNKTYEDSMTEADHMHAKHEQIKDSNTDHPFSGFSGNVDIGIIVYSREGNIVSNNATASQLFGIGEVSMQGSTSSHKPHWKIVDQNGNPMQIHDYPISKALQFKKAISNEILGVVQPISKQTVWLSTNCLPVFDKDNELAEVVVTFVDISEQKVLLTDIDKNLFSRLYGLEYLKESCKFCTDEFDVDYTQVGLYNSSHKSIAIIANNGTKDSIERYEYDIKNTPAKQVVTKPYFFCQKEVQKSFPLDKHLKIRNAESYIGIPLFNRHGDIMGILELFSCQEIKDFESKIAILKGITERASSELERYKTDESIKNQEKRLRLATDFAKLGYFEWNPIKGTVNWDEQLHKILDLDPKSKINRNRYLYSIVHPEDKARIRSEMTIASETMGETNSFKSNYRVILKNKREKHIETHGILFRDQEDNLVNVVGVSQDVTERRFAEKIQKILYNISNAVSIANDLEKLMLIIDKELAKITDTNNFYISLYDKEKDLLTLPFYQDDADRHTYFSSDKPLIKRVIETETTFLADAKTQEKLAGSKEVSTQSTIKPWLGVPLKFEQSVIGVLAVHCDKYDESFEESNIKMFEFVSDQISRSIQRKKSEEELRTALSMATESDRLKSAFLENISHEIRTPMNGILGFTELLKQSNLSNKDFKKYVDLISRSGQRMLNTLSGLMEMSMLETNQIKLEITAVNINQTIKKIYDDYKDEVEKKDIQFNYSMSTKSKDTIIETDSEKLNAILDNLIQNAIKYSHSGSINFGFKHIKNKLTFFVEDTGVGIKADRQQQIFDRFVQADVNDDKLYEGSGLGLPIAKAYVNMLGGDIWVESDEGKGTIFYFSLGQKTKTKVKSKGADAKREKTVKELKILIAEDDPIAFEYLNLILKGVSKTLLHAKNGKEAVELTQDNPDIDLILMDIKMPILGGHEATQEIRKFNNKVTIIAQTAHALSDDRNKALSAGCNDYISKPLNRKTLMEMIEKYRR